MTTWEPDTYLRYGDERGRPFRDLIARVPADRPDFVVDIGCGPATLTTLLARRWPSSAVVGIDNSSEMLAAAPEEVADLGIDLVEADVRHWTPPRPIDVLVANAILQWVPGHLDLLARLLSWLAPGGWLAFQVPHNFGEPAHTLLRDVAALPKWRTRLRGAVERRESHDAATYLDVLAGLGCTVDAWETTYLHILTGEDPVLGWASGTALRPVLTVLSAADQTEFLSEYGRRLREAYVARSYGTVMPFKRIFVVARRSTRA